MENYIPDQEKFWNFGRATQCKNQADTRDHPNQMSEDILDKHSHQQRNPHEATAQIWQP